MLLYASNYRLNACRKSILAAGCRRLRRPRYMQDAFGAARGETGHPLSLAYNLVTLLYVMMHVIFYVLAIYNLRLMFVSTAIPDQKP